MRKLLDIYLICLDSSIDFSLLFAFLHLVSIGCEIEKKKVISIVHTRTGWRYSARFAFLICIVNVYKFEPRRNVEKVIFLAFPTAITNKRPRQDALPFISNRIFLFNLTFKDFAPARQKDKTARELPGKKGYRARRTPGNKRPSTFEHEQNSLAYSPEVRKDLWEIHWCRAVQNLRRSLVFPPLPPQKERQQQPQQPQVYKCTPSLSVLPRDNMQIPRACRIFAHSRAKYAKRLSFFCSFAGSGSRRLCC